jgi:hypothetical protein
MIARALKWSCGLLIGLGALAPAALAAGPSFALQTPNPVEAPYYVLAIRPGETLERQVRVTNTGRAPGVVRLYPVDATTGATSGAVYRLRTEPRRDVGAWIRLAASHVRLAPGRSAVISFRVTVPRGASAGQHLGGIVAENATLGTEAVGRSRGKNLRIRVRTLTIVAVQANLPGPTFEKLTATDLSAGGTPGIQAISIGLRNDGNQLLAAHGTLTISDSNRQTLKRIPLRLDTFVPHTAIAYSVPLRGSALRQGSYRALLVLADGHGQRLRYTAGFTITNEQLRRVFGPRATELTPTNTGSSTLILLVIVGIGGLLLGASITAIVRRRAS